jgi:hypothetical protein
MRYNLNVPDSDRTGCGSARCGNPASVDPSIFIERPRNLSSTPTPLVVAFSGSVTRDPNWIAASASDAFVYVSIPTDHHCDGGSGCQYAAATTADRLIGVGDAGARPLFQDCGAARNLTCDDAPWVAAVVRALERCTSTTAAPGGKIGAWVARGASIPAYGDSPEAPGNGAPPCEHINPREVFVEGGSRGGGMALNTVCDSRTTRLFAGVTVVSDVMISPGTTQSTPPNCPALLPFDRSTCIIDCVSTTPNADTSLQFIWGDEDPNFPSDPSLCDRTVAANDCAGVGWAAQLHWVFGTIALATTVLGEPALGCSTTPSSTATAGTSGKITVTTYHTGCANPNAATQTIRVGSGAHMPDTWPYGTLSGIVCASGCTDYDNTGADGLVEPAAAWSFWTTYFP